MSDGLLKRLPEAVRRFIEREPEIDYSLHGDVSTMIEGDRAVMALSTTCPTCKGKRSRMVEPGDKFDPPQHEDCPEPERGGCGGLGVVPSDALIDTIHDAWHSTPEDAASCERPCIDIAPDIGFAVLRLIEEA